MTMVYSCICFPLQLLAEDTQGKQDRWEEGRRKGDSEDLVQMQWLSLSLCSPSHLKHSRFPDGFYENLAVRYRGSVLLTKRLHVDAVSVHLLVWWVGKKWRKGQSYLCQVEASVKGTVSRQRVFFGRGYSQLLAFSKANGNKLQGRLR